MIVPDVIAPVDYDKNDNEFIFTLENYILRVNYEDKVFELQTPDQIAYHEDFDFVKSPPEWFEVIDFGLVEWIRKAIAWNNTKSQPKNYAKPFSFKVDEIIYDGTFNPKTNNLTLQILGRTIICNRESITTNFPEVQFMEHGQLITIISNIVVENMLKCKSEHCPNKELAIPIVFMPEPIVIDKNTYEFDHLKEFDLILLRIPDRAIQTNMLTIELDVPELTEMHQGMMIDVIRDAINQ